MFPVAVDPERERKGRVVPAPSSQAGKSPPPMERGGERGQGSGRETDAFLEALGNFGGGKNVPGLGKL